MATIDTRPQTVDIAHYAGDTLPITVTVPEGFAEGLEWTAQIRGSREDGLVDAVFDISIDGDMATLTLSADETRRLASTGVLVDVMKSPQRGRTPAVFAQVRRYSGEWDVQVAPPGGGDPTTSLVQGALTIDLDVTRDD